MDFFELLINDCKRCNINTVEYFSCHLGQKIFFVIFFNILFCFNTNHKPWASVTFDLFNVNRVEYTMANYVQCVLSKRQEVQISGGHGAVHSCISNYWWFSLLTSFLKLKILDCFTVPNGTIYSNPKEHFYKHFRWVPSGQGLKSTTPLDNASNSIHVKVLLRLPVILGY